MSNAVNAELLKLAEWLKTNKLSLNVKKTNYILFGNGIKKEIKSF